MYLQNAAAINVRPMDVKEPDSVVTELRKIFAESALTENREFRLRDALRLRDDERLAAIRLECIEVDRRLAIVQSRLAE